MEFGSLGLGPSSQSASNQTGTSSQAPTATLDTNPENTVTPIDSSGASQNDRQQDLLGQDETAAGSGNESSVRLPDDIQASSRRTTLNFDSEQNRIFLEVVDAETDEVIEQIPSDQLVKLVQQVLGTDSSRESSGSEDEASSSEPVI